MKKTILTICITVATLLLSGCAKVPFKTQEPLPNASLVYVYVVEHDGFVEANRKPSYKVAINGKSTEGGIMVQEYKAFDLKPTDIEFAISRSDIEIQKIDLSLVAGDTYYLRVKSHSDDFGKFEVVNVDKANGAQEIQKMFLAGAYEADRNKAITELILPEKEQKQSVIVQESKTSKTEELEKAYALKEKGILSEEEFTKLKQEILEK